VVVPKHVSAHAHRRTPTRQMCKTRHTSQRLNQRISTPFKSVPVSCTTRLSRLRQSNTSQQLTTM
jgi:hypothetical protein